ncbi:MAG: hypothetical protein WD708_08440 [Kiritimatiellia bacterium]
MSTPSRFRSPALLTAGFLILYTLLMFRVVWPADQVIHSADYNYGLMSMYKAELPGSMISGFQRGFPLLGRAGHMPPTWTNLTLSLLPVDVYMDWIYGINLFSASVFLIGFLRLRGFDWLPCLFGALTAFWLGSNLTLIYPGHLEKYGVLLFASATLYCLEHCLQKRSVRWSVLAGGSLGWMFMHQADLALFFGFLLGAYFVCRMPRRLTSALRLGIPMLAVAALFVWESFQTSMETQVENVAVLQEGSNEEKWEFATQWSWPPRESLDLIAPGYWGWMSFHEKVPYHGEMGRSPGWTHRQQGFSNYKQESQYLGILPLALCVIAWMGARKEQRLFWTAALILSFLLSCGDYTAIYRLFYQLPLVSSIRNPNKFLQVFQLTAGILSAYGLQTLLSEDLSPRLRKAAGLSLMVLSLIAVAGSMLTTPSAPGQLAQFAGGMWESQAADLLRNRQRSLLHLGLFATAGGGLILLSLRPVFRGWVPFALVGLLALDGLWLGRHYLKPADTRFVKSNALADFIKQDLGSDRVAVLDQSGLYNFYLTHLFPAHHIPFADTTASPRLHKEVQAYFEAIGQDRLRMWQEFAVKYVLASREMQNHIHRNPHLARLLPEVYSYELAEGSRGGLRILPRAQGQHVVMELRLPSERFTLLSAWAPTTSETYLESVVAGEAPLQIAHVQADIQPEAHPGSPGEIVGVLQDHQGFLLKVEVKSPRAFLRIADRHHSNLQANVNGTPHPLLRTDHLFTGLLLPRGQHEIEIGVSPASPGHRLQWLGLLICAGTLLTGSFNRHLREDDENRL